MGVTGERAAVLDLAGEPSLQPVVDVAVGAAAVEHAAVVGEGQGLDGGVFGGESDGEGVGAGAAAEVAPPYPDGGVVGGGVEDAVVGEGEGVDGLRMGLDGLDAFEIGDSPHFDGLVERGGVENVVGGVDSQ